MRKLIADALEYRQECVIASIPVEPAKPVGGSFKNRKTIVLFLCLS